MTNIVHRSKTILSSLGTGLALGGSLVLQHYQLHRVLDDEFVESSPNQALIFQEQALKSNLNLLKQIPNFGYKNTIGNLVYLDFLQYFGDRQTRSSIGHTATPLFFENIVNRDPLFSDIYLFLSTSISIYAGQPEIAIDLMQKGLQSMAPDTPPNSYYVWRYMAVDQLLFLGDGDAARQSHLNAAEWATLSSEPGSTKVAERSLNTAATLAQDVNSKQAQISAWAQVLAGAVDDETRQLAVTRIESLGGVITVNQNGQVTVQYKVDNDGSTSSNSSSPSTLSSD